MRQSHKIKNLEIINAFKNLDADLLDIVLDNSDIFQEVPKDIFVEKVRDLFNSVKYLKDKIIHFMLYPVNVELAKKIMYSSVFKEISDKLQNGEPPTMKHVFYLNDYMMTLYT